MKRKFVKCMMGICVIGMMSLGVYGCGAEGGSEEAVSAEAENPEESEEKNESPKTKPQETEDGAEEESEEERSEKDSQETSDMQEESLLGDIREIGDGQFRVVEAITGETEDGGKTMIVAAAGAEVTDLKTVVYDENTVFTFQTIWDGGARHEEREGSADDLAEELTVDMKGFYEKEVFHATKIQIVKVVL